MYIYEPLFGDRAAFRVKGLIIPTNKDDTIVALGRVSTVMGEIKDDDYEASLPLYNTAKISEYDRSLLDLPTRFVAENKDLKTKWSGKLPGKRVIDIKHTPTTVTYEPIPFNQQLLIDGFICSSKYYDKTNKKCNFDRIEAMKKDIEKRKETESNIKPTVENIPSTTISESITPSVTEEVNTSASTTEQEKQQASECPVCKYMKGTHSLTHSLDHFLTHLRQGGPCKAEFITWDNCVQELKEDGDLNTCFPHTVKLMECMRKEEYYDIMNVGSDYTHAVAQEDTTEKNQ